MGKDIIEQDVVSECIIKMCSVFDVEVGDLYDWEKEKLNGLIQDIGRKGAEKGIKITVDSYYPEETPEPG